jgi:putative tryptophan/tyrosine transport system substrate-binding protein
MRRREFIAGLGSAATWPVTAWAQQRGSIRRIGVLMGYPESDPEAQTLVSEFLDGLSELGWSLGHNLRIDIRWAPSSVDLMSTAAKELVALQPDVILANSTPVTAALQRETRTIPIVFVVVSDPVGSGFVASLPHPGGNITGFSHTEASLASKWLGFLTELVPGLKRTAMMFNPDTAPYVRSYFLPSFEAAARSVGVVPSLAPVTNDSEIEGAITALAREPGSGFLAMPDNFLSIHRSSIISAAARNKVPAVYQQAANARDGGLLAYTADQRDIFRRAAAYVDSILRGAKASDLPVQMPTKFIMVLNMKTARALGLTIPETLLATADEVIQ